MPPGSTGREGEMNARREGIVTRIGEFEPIWQLVCRGWLTRETMTRACSSRAFTRSNLFQACLIAGLLTLTSAATASAQATPPAEPAAPRPDKGPAAIGVWGGGALNAGDTGSSGLVAVSLDVNFTPRLSLRVDLGSGSLGEDPFAFRRKLRRTFFTANAAYDWGRGAWRPYVTGGIGMYRATGTVSLTALQDPAIQEQLIALGLNPATVGPEESDNELGVNFGGGVEYMLGRQFTVGGDVRWHAAGDLLHALPIDGSFLSLAVGVKRYF